MPPLQTIDFINAPCDMGSVFPYALLIQTWATSHLFYTFSDFMKGVRIERYKDKRSAGRGSN